MAAGNVKFPRILPSDDVDFPDVFFQSTPDRPPTVPPLEQSSLTNQTKEVTSAKETFVRESSGSDTAALSDAFVPGSHSHSSDTLRMSLKEQVRPGQSRRAQFHLIPSKVALLVIDIQEYLSHPNSKQDEQEHAFFFRTSLPRTVCNVKKLLEQTRQQRDSQSQGCEVVFTYLEALTPDCRDVSLDYKLSGPHLATLPNSSASPATFLNSVTPLPKQGKGDILIPKTSCSVFMSTNLHYVLQNLHVEQLLVCGQLTDQCVESAVRDAADLGYFVTVVEDACAAQSEEAHQKGLSGMKGFSRLLATEQVLAELQNPSEDLFVARSFAPAVIQEKAEMPQAETVASLSHLSIVSTLDWNAPPCNEETATTALLHTLQFASVKFLRYMTIDAFNSIRCKAVSLHHLSKNGRLSNQVSIAQVCFAGLPTYGDVALEGTGLDARHVLRVQPDLSTLRILPYAPTSAVVLGTAWDSQNRISPLCTRGLLSRVVETARNHGIEFNIGAEIEFCLYRNGHPVDESVFGNVTTMNEQQVFIDDLYDSLHKQQIQVEQIHAESAPGQLELVLEYQPSPLRMADWVLLAREAIAAVAKNHKLQAVFLPKVLQNQAGNGCHLHLSFANHPFITGQNLSWRAQSFLEGILRHLPSLLALTLPTGNSFRRVGAGCWTGSVVGWETEDKEAALRVCMDGLNVEYKLCDSTANLYLALSGLLACGLDGIAQNLALRPSLLSQQASGSKQDALPSSLHKSLECLQKDELLCGVMGPELSQAYIAVREVEAQMSAGIKLEEEVEVALGKI